MQNEIWRTVATAASSITAGFIAVIALVVYERIKGRTTTSGKFVGCLLLGIAVYTLIITIIGHFYMNIPITHTIADSFGEPRFAWLFVGLAADGAARMYGYFD